MALTNYERQKRWREKHRAIYNLRRRNARKALSGVVKEEEYSPTDSRGSIDPPTAQSSTIDQLRTLVKEVSEAPVEPTAKALVFKDDYGRVISESQFSAMQKKKEEAKVNGYEIDEFSQL